MKKIKLLLSLAFVFIFTSLTFADWEKDETGKYKFKDPASGQYVLNNWVQAGNGFYYVDSNGYVVNGWYLINGKYYLFDNNGLMQVGFVESGDKTYYLDPASGQMVTGWIQINNDGVLDYYYFADDGRMYDGWNKINDKWFYFLNGKCLVNTFAEINGVWFHFGINGAMDTGWVNANKKMYYFNSQTGGMMKGWIQDQNGFEYYLSEIDGSLVVNTTAQIGGRMYGFDATGRCIAKEQGVYMGVYVGEQGLTNYGVNLGISPGLGAGMGVTSFEQDLADKDSLQTGATEGPK